MIDKRLMREGKRVSGYLLGTVALGIGIAFLAVAQAWLVSQVIAQVFLQGATLAQVRASLIGILGMIGARSALQFFSELSAREAAIRVKESLRDRFLNRLLELGPIYTRGERAGELLNTAVEGIEALDEYFSRYIPQLVLAVFIPLIILGFVFPQDVKSGIILLITGPLIPFFMILIGKLAEKKSLEQWQSLSRMSAHFLDMLQGLTTLKVFGRSKDQGKVISRVSESFRKVTLGVLKIAFLSAFVLEFMAMISTALIAVALGLRLIDGTITYSEALFLLILAPEFYLPLRTLGSQFHARLSGENAAQRIFGVLELEREYTSFIEKEYVTEEENVNARIQGKSMESRNQADIENTDVEDSREDTDDTDDTDVTDVREDTNSPDSADTLLAFEHIHLRYDRDAETVLNDICFEVRSGERIALVGPSGAGKSSILQILLRFVEPTRGEVRVKGCSLNHFPMDLWREKISYISQKPYLFAGSILDNLLFGRISASIEEVVEAAKKALAHEFILQLPQGYDTLIGEEGARLSGGQAQRIAIARAFLKESELLLLDEVASGLDSESEREMLSALEELCKGRTVIFTTHRMNTVLQADRIVVIDQGRILEQGSHHELMEAQGLYSRFAREYRGGAR